MTEPKTLTADEQKQRDLNDALLWASRDGTFDAAKYAIDGGAQVNAKDNDGATALIIAADNGNAEIVKMLVEHGAKVDAKDNEGWTALVYAAANGSTEIAKMLVEHGAQVDAKDNEGLTALMYAARNGTTEIAKMLLAVGADLEPRDKGGENAVDIARRYSHPVPANYLQDVMDGKPRPTADEVGLDMDKRDAALARLAQNDGVKTKAKTEVAGAETPAKNTQVAGARVDFPNHTHLAMAGVPHELIVASTEKVAGVEEIPTKSLVSSEVIVGNSQNPDELIKR